MDATRRKTELALLFTCVLCAVSVCASAQTVRSLELEVGNAKLFSDDSASHRGLPQMMRLFEVDEAKSEVHMQLHNASLHGGITAIGEYFTRIKIGSQTFRVQVDTGSSTLAIPLAQCRSCLNGDLRYAIDKSPSGIAEFVSCDSNACGEKTCRAGCTRCHAGKCCAEDDPTKCGFYLRYGDGSGAQGSLMYDVIEWGGLSVKGYFGGVLRDSRDFEQQGVDGILGLAYPSLGCAPTCVSPVFDLMVDEKLVKDVFGICMYENGGIMTLGGYDENTMRSEMIWVPMMLSFPPTFYTVSLPEYMVIGGRNVQLPNFRSAIVDSGTTLLVVSTRTFIGMLDHLQSYYCHIPGICSPNSWFRPVACVKMQEEGLLLMPDFEFQVGRRRSKLVLRPQDYMIPFKVGGQVYRCVGIGISDGISEVDVILGNTLNMRYVTVYDRHNNRMGFAEREDRCGVNVSKCENLVTCQDCADSAGCSYNYVTRQCSDKTAGRSSFFPYPNCSGSLCFCRFGVGSWVFSAIILIGLGALIAGFLFLMDSLAHSQRRRGYRDIPSSS
mmetsp:Transcript_5726/g.17045  ORF Transcript_5726/g.17045 Transcript_5726/m.17045 type:complete len:553 (-) Transcript_5726:114-1772(-)